MWSNRIHNLDNEATITLKLDEGVKANVATAKADLDRIIFVEGSAI